MYKVDAVLPHHRHLKDAVVIYGRELLPPDLLALYANGTRQLVYDGCCRKPVLLNDPEHLFKEVFMLAPLLHERVEYCGLALGIDDMYLDLFRLQEAAYPVNGLDEVVKLVPYPQEYGFMAMPLKVASAAGDIGLCGKVLYTAVGEVYDPPLPRLQVLAAVNIDYLGPGLLYGMPLCLKVVPD